MEVFTEKFKYPGYLYAMRSDTWPARMYKLGLTNDVERRLKESSSKVPPSMRPKLIGWIQINDYRYVYEAEQWLFKLVQEKGGIRERNPATNKFTEMFTVDLNILVDVFNYVAKSELAQNVHMDCGL